MSCLTLAYLARLKGLDMKIVKPCWYDGKWNIRKQLQLLAELNEAETLRSLTKEERRWISKVKAS